MNPPLGLASRTLSMISVTMSDLWPFVPAFKYLLRLMLIMFRKRWLPAFQTNQHRGHEKRKTKHPSTDAMPLKRTHLDVHEHACHVHRLHRLGRECNRQQGVYLRGRRRRSLKQIGFASVVRSLPCCYRHRGLISSGMLVGSLLVTAKIFSK